MIDGRWTNNSFNTPATPTENIQRPWKTRTTSCFSLLQSPQSLQTNILRILFDSLVQKQSISSQESSTTVVDLVWNVFKVWPRQQITDAAVQSYGHEKRNDCILTLFIGSLFWTENLLGSTSFARPHANRNFGRICRHKRRQHSGLQIPAGFDALELIWPKLFFGQEQLSI